MIGDIYKNIIIKIFKTHIPLYPLSTMLDLVGKCNYNCVWCMRNYKQFKTKIMKKEDAFRILDGLKTRTIGFTGAGEPLLYPIDDLIEIINFANAKQKYIVTNGYLLTRMISKKLSNSDLDKIIVSINSIVRKEYEKITGVDGLDIVKQNIKNTKEYDIPISINVVTTMETINSIKMMPEFARELGCEEITFANLKIWNDNFQQYHPLSTDKRKEIGNIIYDKCKKYGLKTNIKTFYNDGIKNKIFCDTIFTEFNVNVDGYLLPCCKELAKPICKITNFEDTWNSKQVKEFRERMLSRDFPDFCKKFCIREIK